MLVKGWNESKQPNAGRRQLAYSDRLPSLRYCTVSRKFAMTIKATI